MKIGLDSAQPPSAAAVAQAKASGIAVWSGYLASWRDPNGLSGFGLYRVWTEAEFAVCKSLPGMPIAFCSGYDNPALCRELADTWGVRLCLDVEGGGLRDDGPWVQAWLDAAQAGLYGVSGVHTGRRAAFHIGAYYPSSATDPGVTWPPWWTRPDGPLGWQWRNTHTEFGVGVDRSNLDDFFAGGGAMTPDQETRLLNEVDDLHAAVSRLEGAFGTATPAGAANPQPNYKGFADSVSAALAKLGAAAGGLSAAQAQQLADIHATVQASLKGPAGS